MGRDASLSEFTSETSAGAGSDEAVGGADEPSEAADVAASAENGVVELENVTPAIVTSRVGSTDLSCSGCNTSARRLWQSQRDYLCAECKSW